MPAKLNAPGIGARKIVGEFVCAYCKRLRPRTNVRQKWCHECKRPALTEYKRAKRAETGSVLIGSHLICRECWAPFIKIHKRQFYCQKCSALSNMDALPANRRRAIEYQKARNKRRRKEIPAVSIAERMSAGIANSLKDGKNGRSWEALVGYTVTDLMRHLDRQFLPGMAWENRDLWHIDHIVPLSAFNYSSADDPEFNAAWALTNLRPLWKADNLSKSAKRIFLL
jgi:hypothetical protein